MLYIYKVIDTNHASPLLAFFLFVRPTDTTFVLHILQGSHTDKTRFQLQEASKEAHRIFHSSVTIIL